MEEKKDIKIGLSGEDMKGMLEHEDHGPQGGPAGRPPMFDPKEMMKMMDYREIGGTQCLGIKKPVIKAHGSSDALAFRNAVKQAMDASGSDISAELEQALAAIKESAND